MMMPDSENDEAARQTVRLRRDNIAWRRVGEEVILLDLRSNTYLAVNASGARLWPLLEKGCDHQQLARLLGDEYGLDAERAAVDAAALVASLAAEGLLEQPN